MKYEYKILSLSLHGMKWHWYDETNDIGEVTSSAVLTKLGSEGWEDSRTLSVAGGTYMIMRRPV